MTHPCERCARPGDRHRIRTVESATLGRTVRVCRFDDECKPALVEVTRQAILEVREVDGKQAVVTHLEEGGGHLRTRWKSKPMGLDQAIEEAGWRALCCAWRRGQGVVYRLRYGAEMVEAAPYGPDTSFGMEALLRAQERAGPDPFVAEYPGYGPGRLPPRPVLTVIESTPRSPADEEMAARWREAKLSGDKAGVLHEHLVEPPDRPPPVPQ